MSELKSNGVRNRGSTRKSPYAAPPPSSATPGAVSMGAEEMAWADATDSSAALDREDADGDETRGLLPSRPDAASSTSTAAVTIVPRIRILPPEPSPPRHSTPPPPLPITAKHQPRRRSGVSALRLMDSPDLQLTPEPSQNGELSDSSFTDVEGEEEEEEEEGGGDEDDRADISDVESGSVRIPLRSPRRKSVMPPILKINDIDYLDVPDNSPGNSITSINSIASLLKEKLAFTLPAVMKNPPKKSKEYKLHIFVGFLFLCIVSLVGFAYVFYHQHVLQRAYFDRIRFNNQERILSVFNDHSKEIMYGVLGTNLGHDRTFNCLPRDRVEGAACMEWMNKARMYMHYNKYEGSRCYRITWHSLSRDVSPTDCYDWSSDLGHWYGGGQTPSMRWPVELGHVKMSPFVTGDTRKHQWGNVVKRYFINSNGIVVIVDPKTPLYVSLNDNSKQFCLQARHDNFSYVYHQSLLPKLNYTICTSRNMTSLHAFHIPKYQTVNLTESDREVVEKLMTEPVWHLTPTNVSELTEKHIYNYTEDVLTLQFLKQGHILINEFWQANIGDLELDPLRFPTMNATIDVLHRRGFRMIFSVQPFISTESINFRTAVREGLLVRQRGPEHPIPALTRYKSVLSAGVIDVTKKETIPWLQNKLKSLVDNYSIDSFYIDIGTAYDLPHYYLFENDLTNPDEYKAIFTNSVLPKVRVVGVSSAVSTPRGPIFVSLPPYASSWESLQSVIATVLTYGIIGFPLILPGPIGGDYILSDDDDTLPKYSDGRNITLPEKELYMRWMQLATFLPAVSFSHLPQKYGDEEVLKVAESLSELRLKIVNPIIKKFLEENGALDEGLPFNRPLWMLDPADTICHTVVDEFSIGKELIVAPVMIKHAREREVYLPSGVWKDGIDGSLQKGGRWLHNYRVDVDKIAFFERMPDDTRF